ncbi:hypothetical protein WICMUC_000498 [Wickerhamomyces mucosus]|uniref:Mediator of RNA polymerase II transcription subunit 31 n=1 Tax=Wickerhamomyces mucosus TaxID=1378264 RepID=A0A9P8PXF8_9ASCO|nr:hypothetical protein WICMUC_000498 [Wickerhamomyces mucosus]
MEDLPTRWEVELEFVQALANLQYLNYLAQNRYLEDETFLNYLRYLQYWNKPEYSKHLVYPNCLHILNLLIDSKDFRNQIVRTDVMGIIMNDMVNRWKEPQMLFAPTPLEDEKKEDRIVDQGNGTKKDEVKEENIDQTNV